jgi:sulfite reductase (NADPH) flavoprotein alpha-component
MRQIKIQPNPFILPETAPFSSEQRAWLGGFFSALLDAPLDVNPREENLANSPALADNSDAPWHDPSLNLSERMQLAEEKPVALKLMAAMAQQDCGQCGYTCADYANALFLCKETRLNLCAPGGKDTFRQIRDLIKVNETAQENNPSADYLGGEKKETSSQSGSRDAPVTARFIGRQRLNQQGSEKETYHIDIDLSDSGLVYKPGDSLGLFPKNPPELVTDVINALGANPKDLVLGKHLDAVLLEEVSLGLAPDSLFLLIGCVTGGTLRKKALALAEGLDPDGDASRLDVVSTIKKFGPLRVNPEAFIEALEALQPRLYSISSSLRANPGLVSLTVDTVRFEIDNRMRLGVASTYLGDRITPGEMIKVYKQPAHSFGLPTDPNIPIIMVGPGTGLAPFRAFLQEREATKAAGKNWLFFGHQRSAYDFFYKDEIEKLLSSGVITELSLAWSREGDEKNYVQDILRKEKVKVWNWLSEGAHFYVCGDAKRMAPDVERALFEIIKEEGVLNDQKASDYVSDMKLSGRYQTDVY